MKNPIHFFDSNKGVKSFLLAICLFCFFHCTVQQNNQIEKAGWLIGTWENTTPKGIIYESWTKVNDKQLKSKGYLLQGKDTVVLETVDLVQEQERLFYIPTVKKQNEGLPVRFALKSISKTKFVFENPEHDFPQMISYTKMSKDSLIAEISGTIDGQERKHLFPMKKVK